MKIGVIFLQTEIGSELEMIVSYAQLAEEHGSGHLLMLDHTSSWPTRPRRRVERGTYDHVNPFHEPFTVFSYLSAVTTIDGIF